MNRTDKFADPKSDELARAPWQAPQLRSLDTAESQVTFVNSGVDKFLTS